MTKIQTPAVQVCIAEAMAAGWTVSVSGKHVVATGADGTFYLGGGAESPAWRRMTTIVPAEPVAA